MEVCGGSGQGDFLVERQDATGFGLRRRGGVHGGGAVDHSFAVGRAGDR